MNWLFDWLARLGSGLLKFVTSPAQVAGLAIVLVFGAFYICFNALGNTGQATPSNIFGMFFGGCFSIVAIFLAYIIFRK
jgi:hypothetical protein